MTQRQISYALPTGTKQIRLPEDIEFETPDLLFKRVCFETTSEQDAAAGQSSVTCIETLELRTHRVPLERYDSFRDAARRVDAAQRENIYVEVPQ